MLSVWLYFRFVYSVSHFKWQIYHLKMNTILLILLSKYLSKQLSFSPQSFGFISKWKTLLKNYDKSNFCVVSSSFQFQNIFLEKHLMRFYLHLTTRKCVVWKKWLSVATLELQFSSTECEIKIHRIHEFNIRHYRL